MSLLATFNIGSTGMTAQAMRSERHRIEYCERRKCVGTLMDDLIEHGKSSLWPLDSQAQRDPE